MSAPGRGPFLGTAPGLKRKMGESFNEKDDLKRHAHPYTDSEPTMIDSDEELEILNQMAQKRMNNGVTASFTHAGVTAADGHVGAKETHEIDAIPSSPPLHLSSEWDDSRYSVPVSPSQHHSDAAYAPTRTKYVPGFQLNAQKLDSETDFGIDKFNRFVPNQCPSTDNVSADAEHEKQVQAAARNIVIDAFENMKTRIDLEGLALRTIPHEIEDLNNLVIFGDDPTATQPSYQLYLTNNRLRTLPPALFKFTKLNVLILRKNKIDTIPALIKNLVNLTDLSIGTNRLKFLPAAVLDLPRLVNFRAGPNPYLSIPADALSVPSRSLAPKKVLKYVSQIRFFGNPNSTAPSLRTLALSAIAKYDVSYQETKDWKRHTPKIFHELIVSAISQGNYNSTCDQCNTIVVEPHAEVIEWWDILINKDVPFKRTFCCGNCVKKWKATLDYDDL